jgi:hypothetical protein
MVFSVWLCRYEMEIINKGDITCNFSIVTPKTPFGPMFTFTPDSGALGVGESLRLSVTFCSDLLGEFAEVFDVVMKGSNERLRAHFKGHVIAPTFHLDADELDFGKVAFEFLNTRDFSLFNTSTVPFQYRFRVPQVMARRAPIPCRLLRCCCRLVWVHREFHLWCTSRLSCAHFGGFPFRRMASTPRSSFASSRRPARFCLVGKWM